MIDEKYIQMAIKLAQRGVGSVSPNPAVGCVIVRSGQVIGRGWHKKFGGPHAEINALEDCRSISAEPHGATMYVTLEPCCHQGKTPPCTDAIIAAGIAKVVVATIDPSKHAGGKGIERLRKAGIEVQTGVCETQAKVLNAPFIKYARTGRCWVIAKWAQSIDGKMAYVEQSDQRRWISDELSRKDAHKLRRRAGAILVGINTVIADDPLLTPRPSGGRGVIRIVLDNNLRIPLECRLLATARKTSVLILTTERAVQSDPEKAQKVTGKGAELLIVPAAYSGSNLHFLLDELSKRGIWPLLVEGGPSVISSFLKENLADEVRVYIAPKILGGLGGAGISQALAEINAGIGLHYVDIKHFGEDVCISGLTDNGVELSGLKKGQQNE
jgi:diaminohydroxyphosphoribosylaminopyrimidine deaminase/5-amino-6-(5-phosphoribosylamino)uracil reductase